MNRHFFLAIILKSFIILIWLQQRTKSLRSGVLQHLRLASQQKNKKLRQLVVECLEYPHALNVQMQARKENSSIFSSIPYYQYMKLISAFGLIVFAVFLFISCPIGLIWALNILFNFHISFNIETWLAAAILYYSFSRPGRFTDKK